MLFKNAGWEAEWAGRQSGRGGRVLRRRNSEMIGSEGRERQIGSDKSVGKEAA